jgi:gamma-glutamylcyclotransferase
MRRHSDDEGFVGAKLRSHLPRVKASDMTFFGSEGNYGRHVYFAFGSNLNRSQMYARCPGALPICTYRLQGWRLVFRVVADIVPTANAFVDGGLYSVGERDLRTLDRYEGVHHGRYQRIEIAVGVNECIFVYRMDSNAIYPPDHLYFMTVQQGYSDWNISSAGLLTARQDAIRHATMLANGKS